MRAHVIQLRTDLSEPISERIDRAAALVKAQSAAEFVMLPELWVQGGFAFPTFPESAESITGPAVTALQAAAKEAGVWLHGGSLVTRDDDGKLRNTAIVISPTGELVTKYAKRHLFGFSGGETTVLTAGDDLVTVDLPWGRAGLSICYDLRFPEMYRALLDLGSKIFLIPSAWPERRIAHWSLLTRARAVENQCFVISCNGVGVQGDTVLGGRSVIVDPWGAVLAEGGDDEEVLTCDLDIETIDKTREIFPVLKDRRK
ncbi:MAG: carbon-nitrogen family hydrolase [Actinobacteria bacterium]|jgi:predicted amidohydrolase|nr:carbon-nitrogen family hydrolase [Actinomycetota bacterium]